MRFLAAIILGTVEDAFLKSCLDDIDSSTRLHLFRVTIVTPCERIQTPATIPIDFFVKKMLPHGIDKHGDATSRYNLLETGAVVKLIQGEDGRALHVSIIWESLHSKIAATPPSDGMLIMLQ